MPALLRTLTLHCDCYPGFLGDGAASRIARPEAEVLANVFDGDRHGSLTRVLTTLRDVAGVVRDRISLDMWRTVHDLGQFPSSQATRGEPGYLEARPTLADVLDLLNRTILSLAAFAGMAVESMTRTEGWRFLDMGRRLERALHMANLLRGLLVTPAAAEAPVLEAIIEVADSGMTYRRRYMGSLRAEPVLDLLVLDETNPRSLASQLAQLADDVDQFPRPQGHAARGPEQRLALQLLCSVRLAEVDRLARLERGHRPALKSLAEDLIDGLPALSESITQQYLTHLQTSRHLSGL